MICLKTVVALFAHMCQHLLKFIVHTHLFLDANASEMLALTIAELFVSNESFVRVAA